MQGFRSANLGKRETLLQGSPTGRRPADPLCLIHALCCTKSSQVITRVDEIVFIEVGVCVCGWVGGGGGGPRVNAYVFA